MSSPPKAPSCQARREPDVDGNPCWPGQDGTALMLLVEHAPAEDWGAGFEAGAPVIQETFRRFGGLTG